MDIQLESPEQHTIQSYNDTSVTIKGHTFVHTVIISKHSLITDWSIQAVASITLDDLAPLLHDTPEIIIVGHQTTQRPSPLIASYLSQHRIGFECMTIGAACRTFNILLSEHRNILLAIVLENPIAK